MKKVQLIRIEEPKRESILTRDQFYWVHLGNGVKTKYKNKKLAFAFLNQASEFINHKLHEYNFLLIEAFELYRLNYFYFNLNSDFIALERKIKEELNVAASLFDLTLSRYDWQNGNHFVFNHINRIYGSFEAIFTGLKEITKHKQNTELFIKAESLYQKNRGLKRSVDLFGSDFADIYEPEKIEYPKLKVV